VNPVYATVQSESKQLLPTRMHLFNNLEQVLGRPIVTLFTSFVYPVSLDDDDMEMLLGVLQELDLSKGLALLISSPGGDGLAAVRIVRACRTCSGTGEYWAIVAGKAKSAATMVCMGASKIFMGPASELGPVDPQIIREEDGNRKRFSVYNYLRSYKELFEKAVKSKGNIHPFLQQLARYDEREIAELRTAVILSEDITVRALSSGMMKGMNSTKIKKKIEVFLNPSAGTQSHGRPIYLDEANKCGLAIEKMDVKTDLWKHIYELYVRTDTYVSNRAAKCIESKEHSFSSSPSPME